jgi:hypothetical protein
MDVLLPKVGSGAGAVELFFLVAATDKIGAEAISQRIRQQYDDSEHLQEAGLTLSTSYRSIDTTRREVPKSKADFLDIVATNIQELMNEETSSRMVTNG